MNIDDMIFEPLHCIGQGNQMQVARTEYKGVKIIERTFIPWSIFKNMEVYYCIDLVFPIGTMDCLSECYYTEEGFGMPEVDTLEKAIEIIDNFRDKAVQQEPV